MKHSELEALGKEVVLFGKKNIKALGKSQNAFLTSILEAAIESREKSLDQDAPLDPTSSLFVPLLHALLGACWSFKKSPLIDSTDFLNNALEELTKTQIAFDSAKPLEKGKPDPFMCTLHFSQPTKSFLDRVSQVGGVHPIELPKKDTCPLTHILAALDRPELLSLAYATPHYYPSDISATGLQATHYAAMFGASNALDLFHEDSKDQPDAHGFMPLHWAIFFNRIPLANHLCSEKIGANIQKRAGPHKISPFELACLLGRSELVQTMIESRPKILSEQHPKVGLPIAWPIIQNNVQMLEVLTKAYKTYGEHPDYNVFQETELLYTPRQDSTLDPLPTTLSWLSYAAALGSTEALQFIASQLPKHVFPAIDEEEDHPAIHAFLGGHAETLLALTKLFDIRRYIPNVQSNIFEFLLRTPSISGEAIANILVSHVCISRTINPFTNRPSHFVAIDAENAPALEALMNATPCHLKRELMAPEEKNGHALLQYADFFESHACFSVLLKHATIGEITTSPLNAFQPSSVELVRTELNNRGGKALALSRATKADLKHQEEQAWAEEEAGEGSPRAYLPQQRNFLESVAEEEEEEVQLAPATTSSKRLERP